jgi:hypothetical protein
LEQASWRRHHGGGIKEEASQRRHLGRRHQGGGIWEEASKEEASKNEMPINIFIKKYESILFTVSNAEIGHARRDNRCNARMLVLTRL